MFISYPNLPINDYIYIYIRIYIPIKKSCGNPILLALSLPGSEVQHVLVGEMGMEPPSNTNGWSYSPRMSTIMAGQLTRGMLINKAKHYIKYQKITNNLPKK